jgi:hypothetical protein
VWRGLRTLRYAGDILREVGPAGDHFVYDGPYALSEVMKLEKVVHGFWERFDKAAEVERAACARPLLAMRKRPICRYTRRWTRRSSPIQSHLIGEVERAGVGRGRPSGGSCPRRRDGDYCNGAEWDAWKVVEYWRV